LHWNIKNSGWFEANGGDVQDFVTVSPPYNYNDTPGQYWEWQMIYEWSIAKSSLTNSCGDIDVHPDTTQSGAHNSPNKSAAGVFARVGDYVWFDANGDGIQNDPAPSDADAGVGNVTVHLY